MIFSKTRAFFTKGDERSLKAKKSILASFFVKGAGIITSLLVIPLTIDYVNSTQYGIWLTINSLVIWLSYFDVGFTNGFKNRFAEAVAKNDTQLAKSYLSTTYMALVIIFSILAIGLVIGNQFLDWHKLLNVNVSYNNELRKVFFCLIISFCIQMVLKVINALLTADQKPALATAIDLISQVFTLIVIYIMTKTTVGSLYNLGLILSIVPVVVYIFATIYFFYKKYQMFCPTLKSVNFGLVRSVIGLGGKFFIIQICIVSIFGLVNIVLVRNVGPESVTVYNIGTRYFTVISLIMNIILSPFWAAYTDAYTKSDYDWMNYTYRKINQSWLLLLGLSVIMLLASPIVFKIWIGDRVEIPFLTSLFLVICQIFMTRATIYMIPLNGIGKVRIQMYIYIIFGVLMYPLLIISCKLWGVNGVVVSTTLPFIAQTLINHVQLKKILSRTATGIWDK